MAIPAPNLNIPASKATVSVSVINTTATLRGISVTHLMTPMHKGHEYMAVPCFAYLVQNTALNRSIIYDLGTRKDVDKLSPVIVQGLKESGCRIDVEEDVSEILERNGVDKKSIEAVVWSHWHYDHTGDPSTFEPTTALIVGPGFKEAFLPGYPANPDSTILESDYAGRELRELSFTDSDLKIGGLSAQDYFGDGSFYLLNAPGHAIGHVCGLARVTSNPDSFIFIGGDACHHMGEIRPSVYRPLPDVIEPNPFCPEKARASGLICPGKLFHHLLPEGDKTRTFYDVCTDGPIHLDPKETAQTVKRLQDVDAADNVFIMIAHDEFLPEVVDFFPKNVNDFLAKGWASSCRWRFLRDFTEVVDWKHDVEARKSWKNPDL